MFFMHYYQVMFFVVSFGGLLRSLLGGYDIARSSSLDFLRYSFLLVRNNNISLEQILFVYFSS